MMKRATTEIPLRAQPWIIRWPRLTDAPALSAYFARIADERPNNTAIRRLLMPLSVDAMRERIIRYEHSQRHAMFVAMLGTEVIGYVSLTGDESPYSQHTVTLSINVHDEWRGRGLGSALMQTALSWARSQPAIERVQLEALSRNAAAVALYQRHGFQVEGVQRRAYKLIDECDGNQWVDAVHMAVLINRQALATAELSTEFSAWDDRWS